MSTYNELAAQIGDLTEALRLSIYDPADQVRLLCDLADYGQATPITTADDPIGIAGIRAAGPSGRWASTSRNTPASYLGPDGSVQWAAARQLRPAYAGSSLTGWLVETGATNLQNSSTKMAFGAGLYVLGANAVDGGLVTAPDGTQTARRISATRAAPTNVYLGRQNIAPVSPSTTYTFSLWARRNSASPVTVSLPTIDQYSAVPAFINRTSNPVAVDTSWQRYSRTLTTTSNCAYVQAYWTDGFAIGNVIDIWGCQIETGTQATSLIATPTSTGGSRAADVITWQTATAGPQAQAQAQAQAATAALCRRAALTSLARAIADYAPASSNEATATLQRVRALYDAEILSAGDSGDSASYEALRSLRSAVIRDLQNRGLQLPELITVTRAGPQPALVAAYSLYQHAGRAEELAQRAGPIEHPLFMPSTYEALSP